jgi:hypothetical protein
LRLLHKGLFSRHYQDRVGSVDVCRQGEETSASCFRSARNSPCIPSIHVLLKPCLCRSPHTSPRCHASAVSRSRQLLSWTLWPFRPETSQPLSSIFPRSTTAQTPPGPLIAHQPQDPSFRTRFRSPTYLGLPSTMPLGTVPPFRTHPSPRSGTACGGQKGRFWTLRENATQGDYFVL